MGCLPVVSVSAIPIVSAPDHQTPLTAHHSAHMEEERRTNFNNIPYYLSQMNLSLPTLEQEQTDQKFDNLGAE